MPYSGRVVGEEDVLGKTRCRSGLRSDFIVHSSAYYKDCWTNFIGCSLNRILATQIYKKRS